MKRWLLGIVLAALACGTASPPTSPTEDFCSGVNTDLDTTRDHTVRFLRDALACLPDATCFVDALGKATEWKRLFEGTQRRLEVCYERGALGDGYSVLHWQTQRRERINVAATDLFNAAQMANLKPSDDIVRAVNDWRDAQ